MEQGKMNTTATLSAHIGNRNKLPDSLLKKPSMYKFINILNATDPVLLNKISAVSAGILADYEKYK